MALIISRSPQETLAHGKLLAADLAEGSVIALNGTLGAGKTQLVKGIASGLGYMMPVTSPTFTLVHEYIGGRLPVFHFDFYRLENEDEIHRIGLDDYLKSDGVLVIEWASRFPLWLPKRTRWFQLTAVSPTERKIEEQTV